MGERIVEGDRAATLPLLHEEVNRGAVLTT
jgi:hypothetical protein